MPGLTVNTDSASSSAGAGGGPPDSRAAAPQPQSHPAPQPVSTTYIPPPIPPASHPPRPPPIQTQIQPPSQIQTQAHAQGQPQRSSSPVRPPVSPITPTLAPRQLPSSKQGSAGSTANAVPSFAQGRPAFTHSQPDQVAIPAPPPVPVDFESNPDVLALKSAIGILQLQRQKAMSDIQALSRAKDSALTQPDAFLRDLSAGKVGTEGDRLFVSSRDGADEDSFSDSDSENGDGAGDGSREGTGVKPSPMRQNGGKGKASETAAWATLPKPQNIVRCPPINWSQYAVVGESLDKLHNEQLTRPTQGSPAVVNAQGTYQFKGESRAGDGQKLVGVAAPYTPGRDKLDKKPKGAKR